MVSKGKTHQFQDLDALIAWADGVRVGAATYNLETNACELMSINATVEGLGVGSALISSVEQADSCKANFTALSEYCTLNVKSTLQMNGVLYDEPRSKTVHF